MKMNKKKVLTASLAISLVAILSFGTIAWFNAEDKITNTFKVADSDDDDTQADFSVDVFETDKPNGKETQGNEYSDILPGDVLHKDPTVRNTGSYDMYTRVLVTLSDASLWIDASQKYDIVSVAVNDSAHYTILEKMIKVEPNRWTRYEAPMYDATADTLTYVYYYKEVVPVGEETKSVFTKVTIPEVLQQEDMDFGAGADFTITVKAEAIQSRNMIPDNAYLNGKNESWYAFNKTAGWTAGTEYDALIPEN